MVSSSRVGIPPATKLRRIGGRQSTGRDDGEALERSQVVVAGISSAHIPRTPASREGPTPAASRPDVVAVDTHDLEVLMRAGVCSRVLARGADS